MRTRVGASAAGGDVGGEAFFVAFLAAGVVFGEGVGHGWRCSWGGVEKTWFGRRGGWEGVCWRCWMMVAGRRKESRSTAWIL